MQVRIDSDYIFQYYIRDPAEATYGDLVHVEDEFWERYKKFQAEEEYIFDKLHRVYEKERVDSILEKAKQNGKESIGFN